MSGPSTIAVKLAGQGPRGKRIERKEGQATGHKITALSEERVPQQAKGSGGKGD